MYTVIIAKDKLREELRAALDWATSIGAYVVKADREAAYANWVERTARAMEDEE